jgi:glycosyltransferase involved in cell wall biosynthesis
VSNPKAALNILYFADIRFPLERANGIQTMETCWALAERGHRVSLVVRPDTQVPPRDPFDYYGRPAIDRLFIERAPVTGPGIPSVARRLGYLSFAAGRAMGRRETVMTRDLAVASLLLRLPGRPPLIYESHGYAPDVAAALPDLLSTARAPGARKLARLAAREAFVWKHADGYVTITKGLERELTRRFGARARVAVVPDGVRVGTGDVQPPVRHSFSEGGEPDTTTVVYSGHLYPWKGVDVLVEALAQVPEVKGLIVGGHEQESDLGRLRALASRLGLDSRVTFTGPVAPADVAAQLAAGGILALPNPASAISSHATSPLKLFEYMAADRAIVASDLPAIREVLTHDENAWLVAPGDPSALAAGIRQLAADAQLRQRLGSAARAAAAEYSWQRRAERLEALFSSVLAASPSR